MLGKRKRTGSYVSKRPTQYRRITTFSRGYTGRRAYPKRSGGFKGYLGRRSQAEKNYLDTAVSAAPANSDVTSLLLNYPVPGTGPTQRVGRKICIKSVQLRIEISTTVSVTGTGPSVVPGPIARILLVWDKQVNAAAAVPTAAELFTVLNNRPALSNTNLDNRDRFAILMDKTFGTPNMVSTLGFPSQSAGALGGAHYFKKFKKLNHETIFNSGTTGDQTDIVSGGLYLVMCSNEHGSSGDSEEAVSFLGSARIRYEDK